MRAPPDENDDDHLLQSSIAARTETSGPQAGRVSAHTNLGRLGGVLVALLGCVVLLGWIADLPALTRVTPHQVSMKLNAALCAIALGVGIALLDDSGSTRRRRWALSCALFVVAIAAWTLVEYAMGRSLGIDDPFDLDKTGVGTVHPGRIAVRGAVALLTLGTALALAARNRPAPAQLLATLATMFGVIVVVGYTYEASGLYRSSPSDTISVALGVSVLAAGLSIVLLRTGEGPLSLLTGNTAGGIIVRQLLPAVLITPLLLGILALAVMRTGRIGPATMVALAMVLVSLAGAVLVWRQGLALRHVDIRRGGAEDALSKTQAILAERNAIADSLAASEAHLRQIIATSVDGYIATDTQGQIIGWNAAATSIFGWPASEAIGKRLEQLIVPPEMAEAHLAGLESYRRTGIGKILGQTVELEGLHKAGHLVHVELTIWAVHDSEGDGFHAFVRDISARKATNEALRRANDDLTMFATVAAHDLRTPLTIIAGFAELLVDDDSVVAGGRTHDLLGRILSAAEHGTDLINDLLSYAAISQAREPFTRVDLTELALRTAADQRAVSPRAADIEVEQMPAVSGDAALLQQLLANLVGNALKYVPPERTAHVKVCATGAPHGRLVVRVVDNGDAISAEHQETIFEMFQRGSQGKETHGTGVGLAICRRVAEAHGGSIWVESGPWGNAFCVSLPQFADEAVNQT